MRLIAFALVAAIALSIVPSSFAKGLGVVYGLDEPFFCWVYATDTIPDDITIREASEQIFMYSPSNADVREDLFDYSIRFVSGDEALKDAFFIRETEDGKRLVLGVDNEVIRQPGEAIFHFVFEGKKLKCEEDRVLRVVPYDEYEPVTVLRNPMEVQLHPGELLDESQIMKAAIRTNISDIANRMPHENSGVAFHYLRSKTSDTHLRFETGFSPVLKFSQEFFDVSYDEERHTLVYYAREVGSYPAEIKYQFANIEGSIPVTVNTVSYVIDGPDMIRPGESATYSIIDWDIYVPNRSFTLTLEGDGAELTDNRTVIAGSNTGCVILTAKPNNGKDPVVRKKIGISDGALAPYDTTVTRHNGFIYERITDEEAGLEAIKVQGGYAAVKMYPEAQGDERFRSYKRYTALSKQDVDRMISYTCYSAPSFLENPDDANAFYESGDTALGAEDDSLLDHGQTEIDGHPARWRIAQSKTEDGKEISNGSILYVRNNIQLAIEIFSLSRNAGEPAPKVTYSDLKRIMDTMSYDPSMLGIVQADGAITVVSKEETHVLTAGRKLNLSAFFSKPEITNNEDYNAVSWSVIDAETGEPVADATITEKGVLAADKKIDSVRRLKVVCASEMFHTKDEYEVTVMPVIRRISLDPAEIFLYEGDDTEVTVKAILDPDVLPAGLTWTAPKNEIVKVTVNDDGTAGFRAAAAGKGQVAVREPGGKNVNLKVNVVAPVTGVTLAAKGKALPGKVVNLSAALEPRNAGNRNLEWSVDVDEKVAIISAKGVLKISKEAAPGTVITVTCKALGAPEPVVSTLSVTVE